MESKKKLTCKVRDCKRRGGLGFLRWERTRWKERKQIIKIAIVKMKVKLGLGVMRFTYKDEDAVIILPSFILFIFYKKNYLRKIGIEPHSHIMAHVHLMEADG